MGKTDQNKEKGSKPSLLQALVSRPEKDTEYMADLQSQWAVMDKSERIKFVAGAIFALILVVGMLIGVLFIINYLRQLVF
jgi:hypothetical protein